MPGHSADTEIHVVSAHVFAWLWTGISSSLGRWSYLTPLDERYEKNVRFDNDLMIFDVAIKIPLPGLV